jgi:type VI secretion system protein ImpC
VYLTYDVETGDAIETRALPFVVGVLADLAGHPEEPLAPLGERKFVEIDASHFDEVLRACRPRLALEVEDKLSGDSGHLKLELRFSSLADFGPEPVARQVPALWAAIQTGHPRYADQLDEILHAPAFQELESVWRGLYYLVSETRSSGDLKVKVLSVSQQELARDFRDAPGLEESALFRQVWREYRMRGGEPYGTLIGDYAFADSPEDIGLLERISAVAASVHAPFIAAASPRMFGLEDFSQLNQPRNLRLVFQDATNRWRAFRQREDARYVALVLPRFLLRLPYGDDTVPVKAFRYQEQVDRAGGAHYLWGNAAYLLGVRLTEAFVTYGWCAMIHGVECGGLVAGLPAHVRATDEGDLALKCPTEVPIDERRHWDLTQAGFIGLCWAKGTDCAAFFAVPTAAQPLDYMTEEANRAAALLARLPYVFAVSRFAHYLRAMMRDKIGAFMSREDCEQFLNAWISQYVILDEDASETVKAQFPLRDARIEVFETPEGPGQYFAVAYLRPHFQLDDPGLCARVVASLPPPA